MGWNWPNFPANFFFFFVSHYIISYIQNVLRNLWRKHVVFWYKNQEEKYHWLSKKNCDNLALFISSKSVWEGGLGAWHFVMSGLRFWLLPFYLNELTQFFRLSSLLLTLNGFSYAREGRTLRRINPRGFTAACHINSFGREKFRFV